MPELAEVETSRKEVEEACRGLRITSVYAGDDRIVFDGVTPRAFARAMKGRTVTGSGRRGKYFWLELDERPWPLFHFGMTGWMHVYRGEAERPRFLVMELLLENGVRVGYRDPRRLGRIRLREHPAGEPPVSLLGFDPYLDLPSARHFIDTFARRKAPLKAVLLDQSFSAGVGNWIADEVCYQSGIDPARRTHELTADEVRRVRAKLGAIVRRAVEENADDTKFPRTWLFHYRWGKPRDAVDGKGRPIQFKEVGGRTTAWVPDVQT